MKKLLLSLLLTLTGLAPTLAQHSGADHKHTAPHGGTVKTAGNYHLELVQKGGTMTVYLLNAGEKTMPVTGATATAMLQTTTGQVSTLKLTPAGNQQLVATLDNTKTFRKAVVNVAFGGKSASASFDLTPKPAEVHPAYAH